MIKVKPVSSVVIGVGFVGCSASHYLAKGADLPLVIDRQEHVAGISFDKFDAIGVLFTGIDPTCFTLNSN